jgi:hypothetical protein
MRHNQYGICVSLTEPYWGCADPVKQCNLPHAATTCDAQGHCAIATCRAGFADCDMVATNGCETDLSSPSSCGACGTKCAAGQVCTPTGCAASCPLGLTNCSSSCANLVSSAENCGGCGTSCGSGATFAGGCSNGQCGTPVCDPGYDPSLGCGDPRDPIFAAPHCPHPQGAPYAVPQYVGQTCSNVCPSGWTNCGTYCAATSGDPTNCGACGQTCSGVCTEGQCVQAADLVVVAQDAGRILADNGALFFGSGNSILTVGFDGGTPTPIGAGTAPAQALAGDGTYVYWSEYLAGSVWRTREDGTGTPAGISAANQPSGIAVDATNVSWVDTGTGSVMSAPKSGGAATTVLSQTSSCQTVACTFLPNLLLANDFLFVGITGGRFGNPQGNMLFVQSNGLQAGGVGQFQPECTDGRFVYFVDSTGETPVLKLFDATMGMPLIELTADRYVIGLGGFTQTLGEPGAADSCGAYVADGQGVKLLAVAGQETLGPPFPVAGGLGAVTGMVLAGGHLFANASGTVFRVAVPH